MDLLCQLRTRSGNEFGTMFCHQSPPGLFFSLTLLERIPSCKKSIHHEPTDTHPRGVTFFLFLLGLLTAADTAGTYGRLTARVNRLTSLGGGGGYIASFVLRSLSALSLSSILLKVHHLAYTADADLWKGLDGCETGPVLQPTMGVAFSRS